MRLFILPLLLAIAFGILTVFVWFVLPATMQARQQQAGQTTESNPAIGGDFTLTSHRGAPFSSAEARSKYLLVYFGYASCPDVCPTDLLNLSRAVQQLDAATRAQLVPLFITVDPERDSVAALATYMQNFDPAILALTGTAEEIERVKKLYKVYSAKNKPEGTAMDYLVDHSAYTYLMGADGLYLTHFNHNTPPETMADAIRTTLKKP